MEVSPSVFEHAARFIGRTPWEVSRDGDLIYQAHARAYEYYRHAPIMAGIDIYNLEPEAYGAHIDLRFLVTGTRAQISAEADRVLALAANRPNVCLGTGALPFETEPENVRFLQQYVASRSSNPFDRPISNPA
jgi:hypothetical protein